MRLSSAFGMALVVVAAVITWFPTWSAPYAEDDHLFLDAVTRPGSPSPVHYLTHEGVMDHHFRPLADPLVFVLLHGVFDTDPAGYHLVLFLVHVGAALLLMRLAKQLSLPREVGLLAALLYVTRDLFFPSLVWASGFSDIGSAAAALASLVAFAHWARAGSRAALGVACVALAIAQLTKETAVVVPALAAIVGAMSGARGGRLVRGLAPLAAIALPLALAQLRIARFEESGGRFLYELSLGAHAFELWPIYLAWCFAGVREILDVTAVRVLVVISGYVGLLALALGARDGHRRRLLGLGVAWLVIGVAPALLAPNRVHTSYLSLAAAGPSLALALALFRARVRFPRAALAAGALLVAGGPVLAHLKAGDHLASGGWVDASRAAALADRVAELKAGVPAPPPGGRLLLFGGMALDVRVLGDPRGEGFGPQQVLASAVRVGYGRHDVETLSLPSLEQSHPAAFDAVHALVLERPNATLVIDLGPPIRDLTPLARNVVERGGDSRDLARVLVGS